MTVPGCANPLLMYGDAGGYQIERSLRFNSSDSAYLSRTPASAGNRRTWTFSAWAKRSSLGVFQSIFNCIASDASYYTQFIFETSDKFVLYDNLCPGGVAFTTTQVFRDTSAWFHFLLYYDTTQSTASAKAKLYINGIEVTQFDADNRSSLTADSSINRTAQHVISGRLPYTGGSSGYLSGYLADIYFIDGQALTPSSFTEVSATTGQLIPKAYTGSYGTNGFHLPFSDNSTAAALGTDTSGNGNSWTVNNIAPSNGATYSNRGSLSSSPPTLSGTISDIFDGLLNSSNAFSVNQANAGVTINFSPALPSGSSVKLVGGVYGTAGSNNSLQVNGTGYAQSLPASTGTYTEIVEVSVPAGASGITSIYIYREGISTFNFALYGIKVNDVLLVDGAAGDSLVDTPTSYGTDTGAGGEVRGNYCTLNPLGQPSGTFSNGNLEYIGPGSWVAAPSTIILPSAGKYFAEAVLKAAPANSAFGGHYAMFGLIAPSAVASFNFNSATSFFVSDTGHYSNYNSGSSGTIGTFTTGTVIGLAVDRDNNQVTIYQDGVSKATVTLGVTAGTSLYFFSGSYSGSYGQMALNFGQRAFAYTAPSGFKALCDTNLPAPVVAKPNTVMDVKLYTGNGSTQTISGLGFSPDLVWTKARSVGNSHAIWDAVRGVQQRLIPNDTVAEATRTGGLTAFTSDGFTHGSDATGNESSTTYVAWCWDAGSSTVTNTQGSISSQVRANASAGFSIVTFTAQSSGNATIGHGLGVEPYFIIVKSRAQTYNWIVYHKNLTSNAYYLILNSTAAQDNSSNAWNSTTPTSSVFTLGSTYAGGGDSVAYCFAPVAGYSSMSSYVGNGSSDGPMVWTGFRPKFLMVKRSDASGEPWVIHDSTRDSYNGYSVELYPNSSAAEGGPYSPPIFDFLSNGFKIRSGGATAVNTSGGTFIYLAVAESPFQYSRAR